MSARREQGASGPERQARTGEPTRAGQPAAGPGRSFQAGQPAASPGGSSQAGWTAARSLMVWPVKAIEAQAPVIDALELMERYLIGAIPVLAGGQVVGILTRRLVGGVVAHGLGELPAGHFMLNAYPVSPDTSLHDLARLVLEHDPRLVPVLELGRLIGVVTRTSILKALAAGPTAETRPPVRLESLPPVLQPVISTASRIATEQGVALCMVGGIVRDLLLDAPTSDLDLMVEGAAEAVNGFIEGLCGALEARRLDHSRFGTAVLELPDRQRIDVATARIEFYGQPAALPEVEPGSLWLDLRRRDFTLNSLAIRLDGDHFGTLMDPFDGREDLARGLIRVLHGLSFIDDPTRIFRAVRFEQRFGFRLEPETERLLRNAAHMGLIERLSGERLSAEVELLLSEPSAGASVRRLEALGLLPALRLSGPAPDQLRGLERAPAALERLEACGRTAPLPSPPPELWELRLMVLLVDLAPEQLASAMARMALRGPKGSRMHLACEAARAIQRRLLEPATLVPSQLVEILEAANVETWAVLWALAGTPLEEERLHRFLCEYRAVKPPLSGTDLMALGLEPGPRYKKILARLRALALDDGLSREGALEQVGRLSAATGEGEDAGT